MEVKLNSPIPTAPVFFSGGQEQREEGEKKKKTQNTQMFPQGLLMRILFSDVDVQLNR